MGNTIRLILVEDDPGHAELAHRALDEVLGATILTEHVGALVDAVRRLNETTFDVILLDLGLPDSQGLDTINRIRQEAPYLPIVVLTSLDDEGLGLQSLEQGAQDYLVKGSVTAELLARSIRHAIQRHQVLGENQQLLDRLQSTNEQLREKNARLTKLYNTAHQFVDNVSHEFRTPLTVIKEFATIIRDGLAGEVNAQQKEYLDIVSDRVDDLTIMVDDMLDVSKLEAGMLSTWRRACKLDEVAAQVRRMLRRKAELKSIRLEFDIPADLPEVYCDSEKISRVLTNLTVNAIKFSPEKTQIRVWARHDADRSEVTVSVADQGPGIEKENLAGIFDRFQQLEDAALENHKGFGLGLAIARELALLNLGELNVESEPGRGSTFSFTLPMADPEVLINRYLRRTDSLPDASRIVSTLEVHLKSQGDFDASAVVDEFLQHTLRANDLVLRANDRAWMLLVRCPEENLNDLITRLDQAWQKQGRACLLGQLPELAFEKCGALAVEGDFDQLGAKLIEQFHALKDAKPRTARVLLIDDDRDIVRGLSVRLEAAGYEVFSAHDGPSGYTAAVEGRPDAVILDMRMPGMDGLSMLAKMRQRPETRTTPVIVLSASRRDQQSALDMGARYFLDKPCELRTLIAALHTVAAPAIV